MTSKIRIQDAAKIIKNVEGRLRQEINELNEMFSDTEEWILYLTAAPSNLETENRFPMTPADVSRTRKRAKVETIAESVEEDETLPLPVEPACQPVLKESRNAFKLARMKMKEPSLVRKLRRPAHDNSEANDTNSISSEAPPSKRARKGKSSVLQPNISMGVAKLRFGSTRDSVESTECRKRQVEPIETDDVVIIDENETTKILTHTNSTKKSSLRLHTTIETRFSKRITASRTTVVNRPTRSNVKRKASIRQHSVDMFPDSPGFHSEDDNIPVINTVSNPSKAITTGPLLEMERIVHTKSTAGNGKECKNLVIQLHHCDAKLRQKSNLANITESKQIVAGSSANDTAMNIDQSNCATAIAEEIPVIESPIAEVPATKKLKSSDPKSLSNATAKEIAVVKTPIAEIPAAKKLNISDPKSLSNATAEEIAVVKTPIAEIPAAKKLNISDPKSLSNATAEEIAVIKTPIAEIPATKKLNISDPKASSIATNCKTPETTRNLGDKNFEPVSVKQRVKALENELIVKPIAPVQPDMPVRMTRTKVRAMMASLSSVTSLPEKQATKKIDTASLLKIARKSLVRAKKISLAKKHRNMELQKSVQKENTPSWNATNWLSQSICSTTHKNKLTPPSYIHHSSLLAQMSNSTQLLNTSPPQNASNLGLSQSTLSTTNKNRKTPHSIVHPSRLLAQMSISKQPMSLVNLNANLSTFLPKTKVLSAAEEAEEKRKEERRYRRENNKDEALIKKKALIDDRTEQQKRKREEKERNVLAQRALKEREQEELKQRVEKESEEKARLVQEREEKMRIEVIRKKEEAKLKAAKIEERRVRKEAERLQALKLQEEEQQRIQAQKKKEQEDAERLHAKRMLEEKERKEKEAALKLEKQKQAMKVAPTKPLNATFEVVKPLPLIVASKYDYPLPDLSKGNDSDFSEAEDEVVPSWASRDAVLKSSKSSSWLPLKAILCFFGSKPTTPNLNKIFPNSKNVRVRSSSAMWKSPPRCSMVPETVQSIF